MKKIMSVVLMVAGLSPLCALEYTRSLALDSSRMNGDDVLAVQKELIALGFSDVGIADGWYGPKTEAAVKSIQGILGLTRNGVVDEELWNLLFRDDPTRTALRQTIRMVNIYEKEIRASFKSNLRVYNYCSGENYQVSKYSISSDSDGEAFLRQMIVPMWFPKLGYYVYRELYTPSGDWFLIQHDYYNMDGKLRLSVWNINTFYASEPASIEKRVYLDSQGVVLRQTVQIYKMNTDTPLETDFMDQDIELIRSIQDLPFITLLKW